MPAPPLSHDMPTLPFTVDAAASPPATRHSKVLWRQVASALGWQAGSAAVDPGAARDALLACLTDLPPIERRGLCHLLAHAQSLAELWHLRPEVYRRLALHHSQAEAEQRLASTNPLFNGLH